MFVKQTACIRNEKLLQKVGWIPTWSDRCLAQLRLWKKTVNFCLQARPTTTESFLSGYTMHWTGHEAPLQTLECLWHILLWDLVIECTALKKMVAHATWLVELLHDVVKTVVMFLLTSFPFFQELNPSCTYSGTVCAVTSVFPSDVDDSCCLFLLQVYLSSRQPHTLMYYTDIDIWNYCMADSISSSQAYVRTGHQWPHALKTSRVCFACRFAAWKIMTSYHAGLSPIVRKHLVAMRCYHLCGILWN